MSILKNEYASIPSDLFISYPYVEKKIYVFYDSVHLLENIQNNILNAKRYIFLFNGVSFAIPVPSGEISWSLLHAVHDKDEKLYANL